MTSRDDVLVKVASLVDMVGEWGDFLSEELPEKEIHLLRRQKPGRKPKQGPK